MSRPRVLLIDDSRTAQATLARGLEEAGYYSASMTPELAAQARDFGVAALLEKPVSPERLVEAVRTATALPGRRPHPAAEP